ncbi:MAG: hypothetical protein KY475_06920 [Planctomycetes bacterium]|nr:hypothetical protein [Planctomycetota bacterium]
MLLLLRLIGAVVLAAFPSRLKVAWLRWVCGYRIGRRVRIGFGTIFFGVEQCQIGDDVRIGLCNCFFRVGSVQLGDHVAIGSFNLFRGGDRIEIGDYSSIFRMNICNAILDPDAVTPLEPVLRLGRGVVVTTGHWIDFSDRITLHDQVIVGGRNSSFWTHNRQRTRPIMIGEHCYLGSEIRVAPGVEVAPYCIVAIGSVLMGSYEPARSLIMGNPATVQRPLSERDMALVTRKTRNDMPDEPQEAAGRIERDDRSALEKA